MKKTLALFAAVAAVVAAPAFAQDAKPDAGTYNFDPDHSAIVFDYSHMGFSESFGFIRGVTGTVTLDPADPTKSTVEASFPLSSVITMAPGLDEHMRGKDLFNDAEGKGVISFKSTKVEVDDDGDEAKVTGDMTLNGVTKPVTLDVDLNKSAPNPMSNKPSVGFDAEGKILRSDFNLGFLAPAVGDEIEFKIGVEASKAD